MTLNKNKKLSSALKESSGLTLIELLIVIALLSIILLMGFTLFFFGITSFQYGERQADVQQNARIVTEFISDAIRIAERVIIIDQYDGDIQELDVSAFPDLEIEQPGEGFYVYLIFLNEGLVYFQEVDGSYQPAVMLEEISEKIDFDLKFEKGTQGNLLKFMLDADDKSSGRNYNLETEILILNLSVIEDTTGGVGGTAIIYQVPAPYPAIRRISLAPDVLDAVSSGGQELEARITTIEVADDKTISATFHRVLKDGSDEPVTSISIFPLEPVITNNVSVFRIDLPGNPQQLYFGDYFASFQVEGVDFPLRRFFYLLPVINNISMGIFEPDPTDPEDVYTAEITITTDGVPAATVADIVVTEDPDCDNVFISLVDDTGAYIPFNFSGGITPAVDSSGKLLFTIDLTAVDLSKATYFRVKIGRLDWESVLLNEAFLSSLKVVPAPGEISLESNLKDYTVAIGSAVEVINISATPVGPNATMTINGVVWNGEDEPIALNSPGLPTIVEIIVTSEDKATTNIYTVTIDRAAAD